MRNWDGGDVFLCSTSAYCEVRAVVVVVGRGYRVGSKHLWRVHEDLYVGGAIFGGGAHIIVGGAHFQVVGAHFR